MAVNPYSSVSISGYNSAPPPDDGSQTSANRVEWQKHKTKLADPIKTLSEAINTQSLAAFAALSLTDVTVVTTTATIAEADWHNTLLVRGAGVSINYPAPANLENGWHHWLINGSTGSITLRATASDSFFAFDGTVASGMTIQAGRGVQVINSATIYSVVGWIDATATVMGPDDVGHLVAHQMFS